MLPLEPLGKSGSAERAPIYGGECIVRFRPRCTAKVGDGQRVRPQHAGGRAREAVPGLEARGRARQGLGGTRSVEAVYSC